MVPKAEVVADVYHCDDSESHCVRDAANDFQFSCLMAACEAKDRPPSILHEITVTTDVTHSAN